MGGNKSGCRDQGMTVVGRRRVNRWEDWRVAGSMVVVVVVVVVVLGRRVSRWMGEETGGFLEAAE